MAVTVTLTPQTLAPPACYATEQQRFNAYVAAILATATGDIQWQSSVAVPTDLTLYWLQIDGADRPQFALKYVPGDGAWIPWLTEPLYKDDSGAANAYIANISPAFPTNASAYIAGRIVTFKASADNTGPSTLKLNGLAAKTIKKQGGAVDLVAGDILAGQMVTCIYDGTNWQMQSQVGSKAIKQGMVYASLGAFADTMDLVFALPPGKIWDKIEVDAILFCDFTGAVPGNSITCNFTWRTGAETGNTLSVSGSTGAGNGGVTFGGQNNDDTNIPKWMYFGEVPATIQSEATLTVRATFVHPGAKPVINLGNFFGRASYVG